MRRLVATLLLVTGLWAYGPGDAVPETMQKRLGLTDPAKTYVVDFFASWCHTCRREIPELDRVAREGVEVIGVDVDRDVEAGRAFVAKMRKKGVLDFPVVEDPRGEIVGLFDPPGIPAVYVIRDGRVVKRFVGAHEELAQTLLSYARGEK